MAAGRLGRTEWRKEVPRTRLAAWSKLRIGAKERIANDWVPLPPPEFKARGNFSKMGVGMSAGEGLLTPEEERKLPPNCLRSV